MITKNKHECVCSRHTNLDMPLEKYDIKIVIETSQKHGKITKV